MRSRNILLGLAVMVVSVGTALATLFLIPHPTWVHGFKIVPGGLPIETCSTLDNKCESTGIRNCEIIVNVNGTPTSTIGYSTNVCTTTLRHAEEQIEDGKMSIYQTADTYRPN
jgi:hypothetical protein